MLVTLFAFLHFDKPWKYARLTSEMISSYLKSSLLSGRCTWVYLYLPSESFLERIKSLA